MEVDGVDDSGEHACVVVEHPRAHETGHSPEKPSENASFLDGSEQAVRSDSRHYCFSLH
eukprot:CAMPEP_0170506818 /NCGR_PEP_ID=MMETSP0208-20121228/56382_1 /TAXON_ID=197538 /ORGANISM="Strombidium inclinatum, Strain S3" /LENGTH=58 /DNA_ID=CAMNT_0010788605 /DNA_START=298 /DNA_END=474 /DNA_ORIENTATION=+